MSVDLESEICETADDFLQYRALSKVAVASLLVGLASSLALLSWIWVVIPALGVGLGWYACRWVKHRPDEISGLRVAQVGLSMSALFLVLGPASLTFEYTHEVPEGYERISYDELQPDPSMPGEQVPSSARALNGKRVFIKGYVMPGTQVEDIETFLLVRDQGDCCFGGNPKITDRILVSLIDPLRLRYRNRLFKIAGTFHVKPVVSPNGIGSVYYQFDADYLQ